MMLTVEPPEEYEVRSGRSLVLFHLFWNGLTAACTSIHPRSATWQVRIQPKLYGEIFAVG